MRKAFTLIELLVVVAMLAIIMGAMTTSVNAARHRARVQKAVNDVKVISQAILAYENYSSDNKLQTMDRKPADRDNLGFLLGHADDQAAGGGEVPVLISAALNSNGAILDPWGHPYYVTIREKGVSMTVKTATGSLNTGYYLPNFYRISEGER